MPHTQQSPYMPNRQSRLYECTQSHDAIWIKVPLFISWWDGWQSDAVSSLHCLWALNPQSKSIKHVSILFQPSLISQLTFALEPLVTESPHEVPAVVTPRLDPHIVMQLKKHACVSTWVYMFRHVSMWHVHAFVRAVNVTCWHVHVTCACMCVGLWQN